MDRTLLAVMVVFLGVTIGLLFNTADSSDLTSLAWTLAG